MPRIATAQQIFGIVGATEHHNWVMSRGSVQQRLKRIGMTAEQIGTPEDMDESAAPAIAYVNHGRWVADCPTPACHSAMAITPGIPFLCGGCLNAEVGYHYRPVEWPHDKGEREEILSARPLPESANARPEETAESLRRENALNGHMVAR